jgi:hypothetical protein
VHVEDMTYLPRVHRSFARHTGDADVHTQRDLGLFREDAILGGVAFHKILNKS